MPIRALGLAALLSACAASGPPVQDRPILVTPASEEARPLRAVAPADPGRPSDEIEARLLAAHNRVRASVEAPPLAWSEQLEAEARAWAGHLLATSTFAHDPRPHGRGENLWTGVGRSYTPEEMVGEWAAEASAYRPGVFPDVSRTGDWVAVGHYTQLIWRRTGLVGCAVAQDARRQVLACRYDPPGNIDGLRPDR